MPPKPASRASKPVSKANSSSSKPVSRAASAKPASSRPPTSRRGAVPVVEDKAEPAAEAEDVRPAKKGRVAELSGESKPKRSRVSLNNREINEIPARLNDVHKTVFVFGEGSMGQHGLGPGDDDIEPIPRPRLQTWLAEEAKKGSLAADGKSVGGIEEIACGGMHTLAIDEAGNVRSWGVNDGAALGRLTAKVPNPDKPGENIPSDELESYPFVIESLKKEGFRAVRVVAGDSVSVALGDKGELRCWGSFRSDDGLLGFDGSPNSEKRQFTPIAMPAFAKIKMAQVACGSDHVLALTTTGHIYVWGNGSQSQLGRRVLDRRRTNGLHPERMGLRNIVHVAAGQYHSFAIDEKGTVYGWGLNTFHQLGISSSKGGDEDMIITPTPIDALSPSEHNGSRVIQIEGGEHHSLFLFDNGEVWACGRSDANQCGIAKDHPAQEGLKERRDEIKAEKKQKVDQAQDKLAKLEADGKTEEEQTEAMTDLAAAQASFAAALDEYIPEPVRVYFPEIPEAYEDVPDFPDMDEAKDIKNPIAQISAGTRHNLAISRSGHVYSWGLGVDQQLGLGQQEIAEVPTLVRSKHLRPYTALSASAGGQHCAVLAKEGDPNAPNGN